MKMKNKVLAALAATGLVVAPAAAQSLRASAPVDGEAFGGESGSATVIAVALIAGIAAIAALALTGNDDDEGVSP